MKKVYGPYPANRLVYMHTTILQMAFATITAILNGAKPCIDATFLGLGRGAGNCPMNV
jgi:isopropylmalate/homocitrate/citramalate synthase